MGVTFTITAKVAFVIYGWYDIVPIDDLLQMAFLLETDFYMFVAIHCLATFSWIYGISVRYLLNIRLNIKLGRVLDIQILGARRKQVSIFWKNIK